MSGGVTELVKLEVDGLPVFNTRQMAMDTRQRILYITATTSGKSVFIAYHLESGHGVAKQLLMCTPWNIAPPGLVDVIVSYLGEREHRYPIVVRGKQRHIDTPYTYGMCVDNSGNVWIGPLAEYGVCTPNIYYYFLCFNTRDYTFRYLSLDVNWQFMGFDPLSNEIILYRDNRMEGYHTETRQTRTISTNIVNITSRQDGLALHRFRDDTNANAVDSLELFFVMEGHIMYGLLTPIHNHVVLTNELQMPHRSRNALVASQDNLLLISSNEKESVIYKAKIKRIQPLLQDGQEGPKVIVTSIQKLQSDHTVGRPFAITHDLATPDTCYVATLHSVLQLNTCHAKTKDIWTQQGRVRPFLSLILSCLFILLALFVKMWF